MSPSQWLLEDGRGDSTLALLILFLFAPITSHYQRWERGLHGPFDLTSVAILIVCIYEKTTTRQTNKQTKQACGVFCMSECPTVAVGAFSFLPSCLRFNGFCLQEIMMSNKASYFTYYQDNCLLFLRTEVCARHFMNK